MKCVLTTSDIQSYKSVVRSFGDKDSPVVSALEADHFQTLEFCSWGILEKALADGCEVFVVTSRSKLDAHDQWWLDMVGEDHVIFTNGFSANDPETMASWREFIKTRLDLEPCFEARTWMDLHQALKGDNIKLPEDYR